MKAVEKRPLTAAVIIREARVLVVHNEKHGARRIEPPGGKKHADETPEQCVVREAKEELGIKIRVKGLLGDFDTTSPEGDFQVRMFICEIIEGEPRVMELDKTPGFGWYTLPELQELSVKGELVPNLKAALPIIAPLLQRGG